MYFVGNICMSLSKSCTSTQIRNGKTPPTPSPKLPFRSRQDLPLEIASKALIRKWFIDKIRTNSHVVILINFVSMRWTNILPCKNHRFRSIYFFRLRRRTITLIAKSNRCSSQLFVRYFLQMSKLIRRHDLEREYKHFIRNPHKFNK